MKVFNLWTAAAALALAALPAAAQLGAQSAYLNGSLTRVDVSQIGPSDEAAMAQQPTEQLYTCPTCTSFTPVLSGLSAKASGSACVDHRIAFAKGVKQTQFKSSAQVQAAKSAGQITVSPTTVTYRCKKVAP